jgi:hypothetical protein
MHLLIYKPQSVRNYKKIHMLVSNILFKFMVQIVTSSLIKFNLL